MNPGNLVTFVVKQANSLPIGERAHLFHEMADLLFLDVNRKGASRQLTELAEQLERADALAAQFVFDFNRRKAHQ